MRLGPYTNKLLLTDKYFFAPLYLPQNLCKIFQQVTSLAEENKTCFIGLESQGTVKDKEGQPETKGDCKLCFAAREHYGEPIV